jgi:hypothetical protein
MDGWIIIWTNGGRDLRKEHYFVDGGPKRSFSSFFAGNFPRMSVLRHQRTIESVSRLPASTKKRRPAGGRHGAHAGDNGIKHGVANAGDIQYHRDMRRDT